MLYNHSMICTYLFPVQAFDASSSSPALLALTTEGKLQVRGRKIFVPGCGYVPMYTCVAHCAYASLITMPLATRRGYDVVHFAKQGAIRVVGMELVSEAVSTTCSLGHV